MGDNAEAWQAYVKKKLTQDLQAADFQWSLFVAALHSYRHDSVLRPFPPMFTTDDNDNKDFDRLVAIADSLPSLTSIQKDDSLGNMDSATLELLYWVLNTRHFYLKSCSKETMAELQTMTGQVTSVPQPNYIFEVIYEGTAEDKFCEKKSGHDLIYAFHGSRTENFHSILHCGLQGHMNKNALYGEGTYLSSELSVSLNYSPTGTAWNHSLISNQLSCLAFCEIIDDPSVKCQVKDANDARSSRQRSLIQGSLGGEVPEKYYVVQNSDVLRVKYILVYASSAPLHRFESSWFRRHKFILSLLLYASLLVVIALYNSRMYQMFLRKYLRKQ
ncbi:hypothetical protein NP493_1983g00030 [Ridgeia piscesae]|uniref:Poly [ADP-ribose] polymerase n=1 Tax=Ridgeia piscesae TaxID=27915 RepID=A0AAD9JN46_RIDPI|nr:hypothetical protein NP493_1983g00030 [Ridgeia piscesae]